MNTTFHNQRSVLVIDNSTILTNDEAQLNRALSAMSEHLRFIEFLEYADTSVTDADPQVYDTIVIWYDDRNIDMEDVRNLHDYLLNHNCQLDMDNVRLVTDHQVFADEAASYAPIFPLDVNRDLDWLSTNVQDIEAFLAQFGALNAFNSHSLQHAMIIKDDGHLYRNRAEVKLHSKAATEQIFVPIGWQVIDTGTVRRTDYTETYLLYKRRRCLKDILPKGPASDFSEMSKNHLEKDECFGKKNGENTSNGGYFASFNIKVEAGSNQPFGKPIGVCDPDPAEISLSRLSQFESLRALQGRSHNLIIGFDSEWVGNANRKMLSWQFAVIDGTDLVEYVFIKKDVDSIGERDTDLRLETALGRILDDLGAPHILRRKACRYQCIVGYDESRNRPLLAVYDTRAEAEAHAAFCYIDGVPSNISSDAAGCYDTNLNHYSTTKTVRNWSGKDNIAVTLVAHACKGDISGFNQTGAYAKDVMRYLTEAQGGLFTTQPIVMGINSLGRNSPGDYVFPVSLSIRDSMCSAPGDAKSLADLGKTIGIPKVEIPKQFSKDRMDTFMELDFPSYLDYASTDAVISLLYTSSIYGINREQPPTLLSAGTNIIRDIVANEYDVKTPKEFNTVYRGIQPIVKGKRKLSGKQRFYEEKDYEPINDNARLLQDMAPLAYHGGYNSCSEVGFYTNETYDYDLQNAYPTAMCLVPDIDWEDCILEEYNPGHVLTLEDFDDTHGCRNIIAPIFANVTFSFPDTVQYPCLPMNVEGVPVFVKSSIGSAGIYACGPELYLALRLGARIVVNRGFKARPRTKSDGNVQYSLRAAVKQLVGDRRVAKKLYGKGSLEELVLKMFVNGFYGKIAQSVKQRSRWSAYKDVMEDIGVSPITNAVSAAMITSIIRAVLIAAQNQIHAKGLKVYSVTTDGFISDISESELKLLDLYGFRDKLGEARLFLTDDCDAEIWEMKHMQCDLLNFTTRGNVSLNTGKPSQDAWVTFKSGDMLGNIWNPVFDLPGVCAHNGAKSGYISDSYIDRLWLTTQVLTRTGPVSCQHTSMTPFKDMVKRNAPFMMHSETVNISMDFDMKRRPVQSSINTVRPVVAGVEFEIANFTTAPFDNVSEYHKYRRTKGNVLCLRTEQEWEFFYNKLLYYKTGAKPRDLEFNKIRSIVTGARVGMIDIPYLASNKVSNPEKISFINQFVADIGMECKTFTENDWKNARRPERVSTMLPLEYLEELISMMRQKSNELLNA